MDVMRRFFILTLLAIVVSACTKTEIDAERPTAVEEEVIYATIEDGEQTRVELNANKQTVWTKGDQIVRFGDNVYDVWKFNGNTGDRSGSFSKVKDWSSSQKYTYDGKYYAIYPYTNFYSLGTFTSGSVAGYFEVFPEQTYHYNSYDPNSNVMLGVGESGTEFRFQNLMGYLRLSLTGDKCVKSITFEGNDTIDVLTGLRYIKLVNPSTSGWYREGGTSVVLMCGDGVQLTDEPTHFYISLIPQIFDHGFNITVTFTDGTTYSKIRKKQIYIGRNAIYPMGTIDTSAEIEWQTVTIKHSGERVSTPIFYGGYLTPLIKFGYINWGDNIITSFKDAMEYHIYGDGKSSHTVTVKTKDANFIRLNSCAGISEIDLTNF